MGELNEKYPLALPVGTVLAGQFAQSQQAQTQAIINALKPATTTGA